jgi:TonB family protein
MNDSARSNVLPPTAVPDIEDKAPPAFVDLDRIEDKDAFVIEVMPVWKNTVFNVTHLGPRRRSFSIGEETACDFWIPAEKLGGRSRVVVVDDGGSLYLSPFFTGGEIMLEGGSRKELADIRALSGDRFQVPEGARCRLQAGEISLHVNSVPRPRKPKWPLTFDWMMQSITGASFGFHILLLLLVFFFAPDSKVISADNLSDFNNKFAKYLLQPRERLPDEQLPEWMKKKEDTKTDEGDAGKRHKGEAGKMGDPEARKTDKRYGIKGPAENPDPHMARDQQKDMAGKAGIISVLQQSLNMPTSPFGRETASGKDAENALGSLIGIDIGQNWGLGGFAMYGTGRGGGGDGEGTIGVGDLGTIGHCCGNKDGGFGPPGGPKLKNGISIKAPKITAGTGTAIGSLSKEAIRRVIRQHLNEVRFCYEQKLAVKPDLEGRVAVKFVIAPDGSVKGSKVDSSTVNDAEVEACIAKAVARWTFPIPPDGGLVVATYPFIFKPVSE